MEHLSTEMSCYLLFLYFSFVSSFFLVFVLVFWCWWTCDFHWLKLKLKVLHWKACELFFNSSSFFLASSDILYSYTIYVLVWFAPTSFFCMFFHSCLSLCQSLKLLFSSSSLDNGQWLKKRSKWIRQQILYFVPK